MVGFRHWRHPKAKAKGIAMVNCTVVNPRNCENQSLRDKCEGIKAQKSMARIIFLLPV